MKKLNNKGFTLVELIIVIAIIAVLAVVVAPQYIKYVEKARASTDIDTAAAIEQAINVLVVDGTITTNCDITWTLNTVDGIDNSLSGDAKTVLNNAIKNILGTIPVTKSKKATGSLVFEVEFNATTGDPKVTPQTAYKSAWKVD